MTKKDVKESKQVLVGLRVCVMHGCGTKNRPIKSSNVQVVSDAHLRRILAL